MPTSERFGADRSGRAKRYGLRLSRSYVAVFEREDDGGFSVYVPDLPGCASQGDTHEAAVANIREAIESHLEALVKLGQAIPEPRTSVETVQVEAV
jgi:predicted RNase H-like HicB family nuclease